MTFPPRPLLNAALTGETPDVRTGEVPAIEPLVHAYYAAVYRLAFSKRFSNNRPAACTPPRLPRCKPPSKPVRPAGIPAPSFNAGKGSSTKP